jgi:hypothetical protein
MAVWWIYRPGLDRNSSDRHPARCYWITNAPSHSPPEMWSGLRMATCLETANNL